MNFHRSTCVLFACVLLVSLTCQSGDVRAQQDDASPSSLGALSAQVTDSAAVAAPAATSLTSTAFRAGAAAVDISPTAFPVRIAGGFLEGTATELKDRLFARCILLDDGSTQLALVVVDTCMMTQELIDAAKRLASEATGIPIDHMMVSATHTHSAPAAMACLGTRQDEAYAAWLPGKIAEALIAADQQLQPARVGWASMDDWEHTHNRRWIRKADRVQVDPFGQASVRANMHPGHLSPDIVGPSGPVDPTLSIISLQTSSGQPLAVFANYSQHYFGSDPVSSDYYGLFCKHMASLLDQPGDGNGPFVAAISQGTSGDLMWMDYGTPAESPGLERYAEAVASYAEMALAKIEYHDHVPIGIVEQNLTLRYRVPDDERLQWAGPVAEKIENELPKNVTEVYALEAMLLHARQQANVKLQAIRIGDLTIATLPNEVYALTGLKLRGRSPGKAHFNIELANGAVGYIPPPEQHPLGGYTTWPARTAGLEDQAERKIMDTLVQALEQVTGQSRRTMKDEHGPYAQAILQAEPIAFWRLNDEDGNSPRNAINVGAMATLSPGYAWYLPGVGSGSGIGDQARLVTSNFSGPTQINRSIHLAGGDLSAEVPGLDATYSTAFWFWLGERSGASERSGALWIGPAGEQLIAQQGPEHEVRLACNGLTSTTTWPADQWNFAVVTREAQVLRVHINGVREPALETTLPAVSEQPARVQFGVGLQGKLDEIALFDRLLTGDEIVNLWEASGVAQLLVREEADRQRLAAIAAARFRPLELPADYLQSVLSLKPLVASPLTEMPRDFELMGKMTFDSTNFASTSAARIASKRWELPQSYSVAFWFRNELASDMRPVTAYLFSRGPDDDPTAPGEHFGIGGTYRGDLTGRLMWFNGNTSDQVLAGRTVLRPGTWNHVVLIRDGLQVMAFLNGDPQPEVAGPLAITTDSSQIFFGARSDYFAPLQGNMAQVAVFDRVLKAEEVALLHSAAQQPTEQNEKNPGNSPGSSQRKANSKAEPLAPDSQPLEVDASLKKIHVPRGYRVELVAAEPEVIDPVAFDWDEAGRLWVVEMSDYPLGMDGRGQPGGRVRVLEDCDGDGRYESSRVFAEGLAFPNGILTWRDGVLVTAAPELLFLRDTDGDGVADQREVLMSGFNEGNQQLRMNHLRWGVDNWVYCANGGHHANHGLSTRVTSHRNGMSYAIGSRDFRFRPDTGELELESGPSQYGRNRDAWGHWFGTQNANPLWHYVLSDRYLGRNPHVPTTTALKHLVGPDSPKVYPVSPLEKRFHSFEQSGRFTSACSGMIYNDELLFGRDGLSHAFTCEPFHNLVQHNVLFDTGVSYQARRPLAEGQYDFFASEDRWCRPVMVRTGPDGGLWLADMYRYMIEHPDWLPAEGQAELLPHYRLGDQRGRIYRVLPSGDAGRPQWAFDALSTAGLVAALESPNDWRRDKAQQLLIWNADAAAVPLLQKLLEISPVPEARLHALWILDGLDALSETRLVSALADVHPRVRENALRVAESRETQAVLAAASRLVDDVDLKVCMQLALSVGQWKSPVAGEALVALAVRYPDEPFMVAAVLSSALPHGSALVRAVLRADQHVWNTYRSPLLRQALGAQDFSSLALLLQQVLDSEPEHSAEPEHSMASLDGLLALLQQLGADLHQLAANDRQGKFAAQVARVDALLAFAQQLAEDESQPEAARRSAAILLCRPAKYRRAGVELLASWLRPQVDSKVQADVLGVLTRSGDELVPEVLGDAWSEFSPELRNLALQAWLSREAWTTNLLDRLEAQTMSVSSLDLTQRSRLLQHPSEAIARRSSLLLKQAGDSTRREIVEQYRPALQLQGRSEVGHQVYVRACASCHQRGGEGHNVGPNLASVVEHSAEKLLTNILDPNADIQPGYHAYTCLLDSGEVLSGIIVGETANSVTIKDANGLARTISRGEIERLQNTNLSFMPQGMETLLTHQELADLLAFLHTPVAGDSPQP